MAGGDKRFEDVEFGEELPEMIPDITLPNVKRFTKAARMPADRFTDHEAARKAGLPGAIVPGIMSQGFFVAMIHRWAPNAKVRTIDTIFRAAVIVDSQAICKAIVTDMDEEAGTVELDLTLANDAGETRVLGTATITL